MLNQSLHYKSWILSLLLVCLETSPASALPATEDASVSAFRLSLKQSPHQPRAGNLRLTNHIARGQLDFQPEPYYAWRGDWEYYFSERVTVNGVLQIPFNRVANVRVNYMGIGMTGHFLRFGDLGFIAGANGGFDLVSHSRLPNGLEGAINLELGALWQGDHFLLGTYYHLMFTINYHIAGYSGNNTNLDLNHLVYAIGFGSTL